MEQAKNLSTQYVDVITKQIEAAQKDGVIPTSFAYAFNGHEWVLTLPHTVMEQKRLLHLRGQYSATLSFDDEEAFLEAIVPFVKCDGHPMNLNDFNIGELEVLKMAYSDGLIAPLFQGGDRAVTNFMEETVKRLGRK